MSHNIKYNNGNDEMYFNALISKYDLGVDYEHLSKLKEYHKLENASEALLYYIWYKLGEGLTNISHEHEHALSWIKIKFYYMEGDNRPVGFFYFDDVEDFQVWTKLKKSIVSKLGANFKVYVDIFEKLLINNKEAVA